MRSWRYLCGNRLNAVVLKNDAHPPCEDPDMCGCCVNPKRLVVVFRTHTPCAKTPLCAILMKTTADIAAAPRVRYLQRDHNTTNREGISTCTHAMSVGKFAPPQSWALIHTQHAATMSDGARAGSTDASQASQASRHEVDSTRPYIFGAGRGTGTK